MNKAHEYAQALFEITAHANAQLRDEHVNSFLKLLKDKGHIILLSQIIKKFEHIVKTEGKKKIATLTVAKISDSISMQKEAITYHDGLKIDSEIEVYIDEHIIEGFVLKDNDLIIDASYKNMLINMYRKLIA